VFFDAGIPAYNIIGSKANINHFWIMSGCTMCVFLYCFLDILFFLSVE